jgi:hypothetical protein
LIASAASIGSTRTCSTSIWAENACAIIAAMVSIAESVGSPLAGTRIVLIFAEADEMGLSAPPGLGAPTANFVEPLRLRLELDQRGRAHSPPISWQRMQLLKRWRLG